MFRDQISSTNPVLAMGAQFSKREHDEIVSLLLNNTVYYTS